MVNRCMSRVLGLAALSAVAFASTAARAQSTAPATEATPPIAPSATPAPTTPPTPAATEPPAAPPPGPGEPGAHHGGGGDGHGHGGGHGGHGGHGEGKEAREGGGHDGRMGEGAHDGGGHEAGGHMGRGRPYLGGLGYASVGLMTGGFSAMQNTLSQSTALGGGYDAAPTGFVFGGGGGVLLNRLWVGAKGFGLLVDTPNSSRGSAKLSGIGGGGEVGYAVVASPHWLVVPFVGVGGFGYSLKVTNAGSNPLPVYANETIGRGAETKYTAGFVTGELGLRVSRLLLWGNSGLMVGAELGYLSALQRAAWESSSGTSAPESAELRGGYFKLLIGGGGFSHRGGGQHDGEHHAHD